MDLDLLAAAEAVAPFPETKLTESISVPEQPKPMTTEAISQIACYDSSGSDTSDFEADVPPSAQAAELESNQQQSLSISFRYDWIC